MNDGQAAELSRLGAELETLFGIACFVEIAPGLPPTTSEQCRQLYRIAQEAARNAIRHGMAKTIEISLRHGRDHLELSIRNDGECWMQTNETGRGLGLRIMRYRAGMLGGTLTIHSEADGRTAVICQPPIRVNASDGLPRAAGDAKL